MTKKSLQFANLSERHPGVTVGLSMSYAEAASVCLDRHHASPSDFAIQDNGERMPAGAEWEAPDERTKKGWANTTDATEAGAYGVAIAAAEATRELYAVSRAEVATGADYYLHPVASPPEHLEDALRLEVSGTDTGNIKAIRRRLLDKIEQVRNGKSNLPAIAIVVGFEALYIEAQDVDET